MWTNSAKGPGERTVGQEALSVRHAEAGVLLAVLGITTAVLALLTQGRLLAADSLTAMAFQLPMLGLLSLAQMVPMLTGGIDLSIVSTANFAGIAAALVLKNVTAPYVTPLAMGTALATALAVGLLNGFIIARLGVPPIIATLATMILVKGVALAITRGYVLAGFPPSFLEAGAGSVWGVPVPFLLFAVCAAALGIALARTPFGVKVYMMGSNPTATLFSGVNVRRLTFQVYLLSALMAGMASIVMMARFNAAQADYGASFLLLTVLINVLGGIDPAGGIGSILGLVLAVVILQLVATGFNLVGFSSHLASAMWGLILLVVIILRRMLRNHGPAASSG